MTRLTLPLTVLLLANTLLSGSSLAGCAGGGGYHRPAAVRSYAAPAIRYAQPQRTIVVHRPVQTIRTVIAAPQIVQSAPSIPQIRLAPTQIQPRSTAATVTKPVVSQSSNIALQTPSTPNVQPSPASNSGLSALAILSGQQQQAPAASNVASPADATTNHIGVWKSQANSKATVTLNLNSDGSFEWSATTNGTTQRFSGKFEISGGKLTLVRSSDNQKLAGTMTFNGAGFNFKLDGAKDNGLNFSRQS